MLHCLTRNFGEAIVTQAKDKVAAGIQKKLGELPEESHSLLASAIPRLQILPADRWGKLAEYALEGSFSGYAFDPAQAGKELGVSFDDARLLFNAAGFLSAISTVFDDADASIIVETLRTAGIVPADSASDIESFVQFLIKNRSSIAEDYERSALANTVLPTLQRFDTNVDIRLSKSSAKRMRAAPVVVACLDTDAEGQIVWFQMSKGQVKRIMSQLEGVLEQLELAESVTRQVEEAGQERGGE